MIISHRDIFVEAWKSARRTRGQHRTLRASFAAALRRVWALVKAMATQEATRRPVASQRPQASTWASENSHRAAAVASRNARLGSLVASCW